MAMVRSQIHCWLSSTQATRTAPTTSRTSRPADAHPGTNIRDTCREPYDQPAWSQAAGFDTKITTAGEEVITTDTQVLRRDGLDVVALPQT